MPRSVAPTIPLCWLLLPQVTSQHIGHPGLRAHRHRQMSTTRTKLVQSFSSPPALPDLHMRIAWTGHSPIATKHLPNLEAQIRKMKLGPLCRRARLFRNRGQTAAWQSLAKRLLNDLRTIQWIRSRRLPPRHRGRHYCPSPMSGRTERTAERRPVPVHEMEPRSRLGQRPGGD